MDAILEALKSTALTLLPVVIASFSPVVTAVVKKAADQSVGKLPNTVKPAVNALIGALISVFVGGSPVEGVIGAQVGKSVRDQLDA